MKRVLAACLLAGLLSTPAAAQERGRDARQLLPQRPLLYAQVAAPGELAGYVMEHPLRGKLEGSPVYRQAAASPGYQKFQLGLAVVQSQLGRKWQDALAAVAGGGVHLAFDPRQQGFVVLARATDADYARQTGEQLTKWAQHVDKTVEVEQYRGVRVVKGKNDAASAVFDGWIAAASKPKLLRQVIDRHRDGGASLADNDRLAKAAAGTAGSAAWAFVDLQMLRQSGQAEDLFSGRSENPAAELLLGGVLSTLQHADHATATLTVRGNQLRLAAAMPHQTAWAAGAREHYFGAGGGGVAPGGLQLDGTLLTLAAHRDIARMWLQADDLFPAATVDSLAEADSTLTTLFAGRDFGEDILGALRPEVQLVVARQSFAALPRPALRLPGFALVARLKEPDKMRDDLRRTFQSLIGFLNVVGAMEGNPQFDQSTDTAGRATIHRATYVPEPEEAESETARIHFNFSPAVAFAGDRAVFSSSAELARKLVQAPAAAPREENTFAELNVPQLRKVLADNKPQLIAQNILEKGNSQEEADGEVSAALDLAAAVESVRVRLTAADELRISVEAELSP